MTNIDRKEIENQIISTATEVGFIEPANSAETLSSLYIVGGQVSATRDDFCTFAKALEERFDVEIDANVLLQNKRLHGGSITQNLQPQGGVQFPTTGHIANTVIAALQKVENTDNETTVASMETADITQ
jgi:hypothetical protein